MLDNCINNCCIATTYKLMTKMHHFISRKKIIFIYCSCTKLKKKDSVFEIFLCLPLAKIEEQVILFMAWDLPLVEN